MLLGANQEVHSWRKGKRFREAALYPGNPQRFLFNEEFTSFSGSMNPPLFWIQWSVFIQKNKAKVNFLLTWFTSIYPTKKMNISFQTVAIVQSQQENFQPSTWEVRSVCSWPRELNHHVQTSFMGFMGMQSKHRKHLLGYSFNNFMGGTHAVTLPSVFCSLKLLSPLKGIHLL